MILQQKTTDDLKPYLEMIWYVNKKMKDANERKDIIMPTGHFHVVFNFSDAYNIENQSVSIPNEVLIGPFKSPLEIEYGQMVHQLGLAFTPIGYYMFFHKLPGLFKGVAIDISEHESYAALIEVVKTIESRLDGSSEGYSYVFEQIQSYFLNALNHNDMTKEMEDMMEYLTQHQGQIDVKAMANHFSYSLSGLERKFKKYFLLTPKAYSNIIKFRHAMEAQSPESFFYDQSHFINTVKKYTTLNPSDLSDTEALTLIEMFRK